MPEENVIPERDLEKGEKQELRVCSRRMSNLDDTDSSSDENDFKAKKKKKEAVNQYKDAINRIGSKSISTSAPILSSKKSLDRAIITENEYNIITDDWMINDMAKKSTSTKRKTDKSIFDDDESDDYEQNTNSHEPRIQKEKKSIMNNQLSKKRLVEKTQSPDNTNILPRIDDLYDDSSSSSIEPPKEKPKIDPFFEIDNFDQDENSNSFVVLNSPIKTNKTFKKQMKLTKMSCLKSMSKKPDESSMFRHSSADILIENSNKKNQIQQVKQSVASCPYQPENIQPFPTIQPPLQSESWKIKAIIEKRNFLIPIPKIDATIYDLKNQILTRYKAIFSNDPLFREPEKCILKNSDDLILFDEDLIKDVLNNLCQVHVLIEKWKSLPTITELYDQICSTKYASPFDNIKTLLIESETNNKLNFSNQFFVDYSTLLKQFTIITEVIKVHSKQQLSQNIDYMKSLIEIDLSYNMLDDQIILMFVERLLFDCVNLKTLNLSNNLITVKSLKAICDIACSNNKAVLQVGIIFIRLIGLFFNFFKIFFLVN